MTEPRLFHPLADMFPLMLGAEFAALAADIKQNRLREPIVRYEGMILDGRNRYRACLTAGIEPRYEEIKFSDQAAALAFVLSKNLHRRHLTGKQKRELAVKLLKLDPGKSDRAIGEMVKSDHKTIAKIRCEEEGRGEIPHVDQRKDSRGRQQPARKSQGKPATPENIFDRRIGVGVMAPGDGELATIISQKFATELEAASAPPLVTPPPPPAKPEAPSAPPKPARDLHAGELNRTLMSFNATFESELKKWLKTGPAEEALQMMHKSVADASMLLSRMTGHVWHAITVSKRAEADNAVPADASADAMKVKMAALDDAPAVSPDAAPSDAKDLDVRTFQDGVLAAVTGKRRPQSEPDAA